MLPINNDVSVSGRAKALLAAGAILASGGAYQAIAGSICGGGTQAQASNYCASNGFGQPAWDCDYTASQVAFFCGNNTLYVIAHS